MKKPGSDREKRRVCAVDYSAQPGRGIAESAAGEVLQKQEFGKVV